MAGESEVNDELKRLREQVLELRKARDEALRALASERATFSAHYLVCPAKFSSPELVASEIAGEHIPLRHRVADAINAQVKARLSFAHGPLKETLAKLASKLGR